MEPPKKGSLDTLSREELIAKCRGLVGTLLKAKQEKQGMTRHLLLIIEYVTNTITFQVCWPEPGN